MIERIKDKIGKMYKNLLAEKNREKIEELYGNVITDKRKKKLRKFFRKPWVQTGLLVFLFIFIITAFLSLTGTLVVSHYLKENTGSSLFDCRREAKETVANSTEKDFKPNQTTYIYSSDNTLMAKLSEGDASAYLNYEEIPENVVNAFVAVEDQSFFHNPGFDLKGMIRVIGNYFLSDGDVAQGASTITQQLSRSIFLTSEKSIERKVREIFIAQYLTKKYSKEQIMEYYINNCCFANNIYGIEDAAQTYFSKSASELTLSETAYLCAIPNRPSYYDPFTDSSRALSRRDKILGDMLDCGFITQEEYDQASSEKISIKRGDSSKNLYDYQTTYTIQCATEYLMKKSGFEFQYHFDSKKEYKAYQKEYDEIYNNMQHKLYTKGYKIYTSLSKEKNEELQKVIDQGLAFDDSKNEDSGTYNLQGALTVIDNKNHKVVGIVGGRSDEDLEASYSLNRACQVKRQPGSTIKPILVYTPAMDLGLATPSTSLRNIDVQSAYNYPDSVSTLSGYNVSLRNAVEQSLNGCALYLYNQVTPQKGLPYLEKMHFTSIIKDDYALSSGLGGLTYGTNTLEMANAYYTLENHGKFYDVNCLTSILDEDGNEIYKDSKATKVYDTKSADTMTDIMEGVVSSGTASSMGWDMVSELPAAGKTGTTDDLRDGWFCGYTPYYTISVWVGTDDSSPVEDLYGATYPCNLWKDAMLTMTDSKKKKEFKLGSLYE